MKHIQNWLQKLGETLGQLEALLKGKRPVLAPIPVRSRPQHPPHHYGASPPY